MSSAKRIFAIERLSDIQLNSYTIKKPISCFLFELEGESRYVTKRTYPSSSETTKLQFHWSIIITSSYHYLFIEKVKSSELLIKQPRYGGSRRRTQIPWLATMAHVQYENPTSSGLRAMAKVKVFKTGQTSSQSHKELSRFILILEAIF